MTAMTDSAQRQATLRALALAKLTGKCLPTTVRADATDALGVLFDLASSPDTATGALTLLHELQVHQVEVDLQDEELRRSRIELENALRRQTELYEFAPVGILTIDHSTRVHELNHTAADLFGRERTVLPGSLLNGYLTSASARALQVMLDCLRDGSQREFAELELRSSDGHRHLVHASARPDPAGGGYLLALMA